MKDNIVQIIIVGFILLSTIIFALWFMKASLSGDFSGMPGSQGRYYPDITETP